MSCVKLARDFDKRYKYAKGSQEWQGVTAFRIATSLFDTAGMSTLILTEEKGKFSKSASLTARVILELQNIDKSRRAEWGRKAKGGSQGEIKGFWSTSV